jgi:hypothetical protein
MKKRFETPALSAYFPFVLFKNPVVLNVPSSLKINNSTFPTEYIYGFYDFQDKQLSFT